MPREQDGVVAYPDGKFTKATVEATRDSVTIKELGWTLKRVGPASACLPARALIGPRSVDVVRLGLARDALLRRAPEPSAGAGGVLRWCADGGGDVVAVLSKGGNVALVATTAPGHARRGIHPGSSVRAVARVYSRTQGLGAGLLRAGPGSRLLFATMGGKVRQIIVAARATIARPALLRSYLGRLND